MDITFINLKNKKTYIIIGSNGLIGSSLVHSFHLRYKFNYKNPVFIRLGIKQANWAIINNEKKGLLIQPSAGLGLEFESFNKSIFKLDYALEFNKVGVTNLISLAIKL